METQREEGTVIALDGETARVRMAHRQACGGCRACAALGPGEMVLEARNLAGAGVGDRVEVEVTGPGSLRAACLVFLLPLLGMVGGGIAGTALTGSETAGLGIGFAVLVLVYGVTHRYDRSLTRSGKASATVIERKPEGGYSGHKG